jgi:hypothetical protein
MTVRGLLRRDFVVKVKFLKLCGSWVARAPVATKGTLKEIFPHLVADTEPYQICLTRVRKPGAGDCLVLENVSFTKSSTS